MSIDGVPLADPSGDFDVSRRYVRVKGERPDGFIEFDFAIGDPGTFIEMVLRPAAFEEFCSHNGVIHLAADTEPTPTDPSSAQWMPRDAVARGLGHS